MFDSTQRMTRRNALLHGTSGFASMALAWQLVRDGHSALAAEVAPPHGLHLAPRAKRVIFLFMDGGPSQMETFDPKPLLNEKDGQPLPMQVKTSFPNTGKVLGSPMKFKQHGECGAWVSELFPETAQCVDQMTIIRSMHHDQSNHANGCAIVHTGFGQFGRPSMGAWVTYGLGSECEELPGFVVINCGVIPSGGTQNYTNGFLPAEHQGTIFRAGEHPIADVVPRETDANSQREKLALMRDLNVLDQQQQGPSALLNSIVGSYELAARMQLAVPELADAKSESAATLKQYGIGEKQTDQFGWGCLMARRMVERGVRFVQVTCPDTGYNRWDQHNNLVVGLRSNAEATDKPVAALLKDLAARGMLEDTLVVWGGEFGRTPSAETKGGRDHNPFGYTMWLAGGGTKPGLVYGATDDYGYFAVEKKVHIHDLHATVLHLLGVDHKRLTFHHAGRDFRLTDVHGRVVSDLFA